MDSATRQQAIDLYDRFTHDGMGRRDFMARMIVIAGSVAAAEALIAGIAASPAAAAIVPENDSRLTIRTQKLAGGYSGYVAEPRSRSLKPSVMVIHENRGLNAHIKDVARRVGLAGYRAIAPDFLSLSGGTPANEDEARDAIGKLDLAKTVGDAAGIVTELGSSSAGGKVGAVGFCWGGGFIDRLAVNSGGKLAAAVAYYGPAPDPAEAVKVQVPLLLHLAGLDTRVGSTAWPFATALGQAGKEVEVYEYPGANHAFNNDTSAERYDKAAATLAWARTLDFFKRHLG